MTCNNVIYIEMLRYTQQMMFFSSKGVVIKNLYGPNNFEPKILLVPKYCWTKFFLDQNFVGPKSFWTQNLFGPKIALTQHCFGPNIFWTKQLLVRIFLVKQNFR